MADNVQLPATGTGTADPVVATDDIGGIHYQLIKLYLGALGAATALSGNAGTVDAGTARTVQATGGTATLSNVNDAATSATLLSAAATRLKFVIYNDSTVDLYVKYGTTASATSFTYLVPAGATLEEWHYNGRVDGIWASDASGAARITEIT